MTSILAIGTDLLEIDRIEQLLSGPRGTAFRRRVFSPDEQTYCDGRHRPAESYAARFAAKEAISKCLGTGRSDGVGWLDIEVLRAPSGAVDVRLAGAAETIAERLGIVKIFVSLSHSKSHAIAMATAVGADAD